MSRKLALARRIYKKSQKNRSPAYCNCKHETDFRGNIISATCRCGENDSTTFDWTWENNEEPEIVINGCNVTFHPVYSQGTVAVKGNRCLDKDMIHYWEIKIVSNMTGTDLMIGMGTDKLDIMAHKHKYLSLLGLDDQSWGYSYRGLVQHNEKLKFYGKRFSSNCIVGVYLDLRRRFIEFYLNRRSLGIAYNQIKIDEDAHVYPMISSTSAKSMVKLINSTSFGETLQFLCMKVVCKDKKKVEFIGSTPGLRYLCKKYWFLHCKEQFQYSEFVDNNMLLEDEALICCLRNQDSESKDESSDDSINEEINIYNGAHNIKHRKISTPASSDDDSVSVEFFCDHFG